MKATTISVALLSVFGTAFAQTLAPSPTNSYGCEPHGDHWHCAGPKTDGAASQTTSAASAQTSAHDDHDDDDDHDHESGTASLAPSPTNSVGCEPHGDHWHCTGPKTTSAAAAVSTSASDVAGTGVLPPSPTASTGCEPHGDHWHCSGPKVTSSSTGAAVSSTGARNGTAAPSSTNPVQAGAGAVAVPVAGLLGVFAMVL